MVHPRWFTAVLQPFCVLSTLVLPWLKSAEFCWQQVWWHKQQIFNESCRASSLFWKAVWKLNVSHCLGVMYLFRILTCPTLCRMPPLYFCFNGGCLVSQLTCRRVSPMAAMRNGAIWNFLGWWASIRSPWTSWDAKRSSGYGSIFFAYGLWLKCHKFSFSRWAKAPGKIWKNIQISSAFPMDSLRQPSDLMMSNSSTSRIIPTNKDHVFWLLYSLDIYERMDYCSSLVPEIIPIPRNSY